jgi:hypothetical protein
VRNHFHQIERLYFDGVSVRVREFDAEVQTQFTRLMGVTGDKDRELHTR